MAQILLAWELGGGLGHAERLLALGGALRRAGHDVCFAYPDAAGADAGFIGRLATAGLIGEGFAPCFAPVGETRSAPFSFADMLATIGMADPNRVQAAVAEWRQRFDRLSPDLLVADYAPGALLAACTAGVPRVVASFGFGVPPLLNPLPSLQPWQTIPISQPADTAVLASVNASLPVERHCASIGAIFDGDLVFITAPEALDYFDRPESTCHAALVYGGPVHAAGGSRYPAWAASAGPRCFAYLSPHHPATMPLLAGLLRSGYRVLAYLRGATVTAPLLTVAPTPVDLDWAAASADLVISHAGLGVAQAVLAARKPLFLMPMAADQALLTYRLTRAGLAASIDPGAIRRDADAAIRRIGEVAPALAARVAAIDPLRGHAPDLTLRIFTNTIATLLDQRSD